jgi:hypothetical protein
MPHIYDLNPHLRPKPKPKAVEEKPEPPVKRGRPKKEVKQ